MAYYRLKLISTSNDDQKYSNIIVLYNKDALFKVSAVNPFKSNLKLDVFIPHDGEVEISLYDAFGKPVSKKEPAA